MKTSIRYAPGEKAFEVKNAYLYRMPNGCLLIRLDVTSLDNCEVDHSITDWGPYSEKPTELNIQITSEDDNWTVVTVVPTKREDVELFRNCYFLKKTHKYRVHYIVCPRLPDDLDPEELVMSNPMSKKETQR